MPAADRREHSALLECAGDSRPHPPAELEAKTSRLQDKIAHLRQQMRVFQEVKAHLKNEPKGQISLTDPDARSLATRGKGSGMVAYNVQVAVATKHHLIVAHEITSARSDKAQLSPMVIAARETMCKKKLRAIADRGYFSGPHIKACADTGISAVLPKPTASGAKAAGRFDRADFIYIKEDDEYQCPAGQRAI